MLILLRNGRENQICTLLAMRIRESNAVAEMRSIEATYRPSQAYNPGSIPGSCTF